MQDENYSGHSEPGLNRVPPQNIDIERAVLGAMMFPGDSMTVIPIVSDVVTEAMFYRNSHRQIFNACLNVFEDGIPPDLLTVTRELERMGKLEETGGVPYLDELIDAVPSTENAKFYSELLAEPYARRRALQLGAQIYHRAHDEQDDVYELIGFAQEELHDILTGTETQAVVGMPALMVSTLATIKAAHERPEGFLGIPTGFKRLDKLMAGLQGGDFIVIAGRPGMGKSALTQTMLVNMAKQDYRAMFFSLEMSKEQVGLRIMAAEADVNLQSIRLGDLTEWDMAAFANKTETITKLPFWVDDTPGLSTKALRAKAHRYRNEFGIQVMAVDYLQLMQDLDRGRESAEREIASISGVLKTIAKELNIPVIGLSQLNRKCEERADKRPLLSDLRQSGAIEQDADAVIFVYRPGKYEEVEDVTAELILAKQRNGPVGVVDVGFQGERTKFFEME